MWRQAEGFNQLDEVCCVQNKQNWPQHRSLRNAADQFCDWWPNGPAADVAYWYRPDRYEWNHRWAASWTPNVVSKFQNFCIFACSLNICLETVLSDKRVFRENVLSCVTVYMYYFSKLFYFPFFYCILGQLKVRAFIPGCPVCVVKLLLLIWCFADKLNDDGDHGKRPVTVQFSSVLTLPYLADCLRIYFNGISCWSSYLSTFWCFCIFVN